MEAEYRQFHYKNATLTYLQSGNGVEPLILFHGFGQDHAAFAPLFEPLINQYTFYSFDLFFHGQSRWPFGERPLSKAYWHEILDQFLQENKIERFSLLGFSLGGKFALASFEAFASKVNEVILLAPDGIKTSTWYSLATYPIALRALFKSMITKPGVFSAVVKMAKGLNLIDKKVLQFSESQMQTEENRRRVYCSWVVFRHLHFDLKKLAVHFNSNSTSVLILIGQFDKIITAKNMQEFISRVPHATLQILATGHNGLIQESVKVLGKYESGKGLNSR
jgi:pimeloyl-ACP methyl ester carboxylesterase